MCALLQAHDVGDEDGDTVNAGFIARLCASDWGLWRTTKMNIERCRDGVDDLEIGVETGRLVQERLERLWARIEQEPKSLRWRGRARVGDRVRWYEEPEEVAHGL